MTGRSYIGVLLSSENHIEVLPSETALAAEFAIPHWYAAQTCSRHEKKAAEHLAQRGIESYLPLYVTQRRWADRRARVELPLFPGYLFVHLPLAERLKVLQLPGVVRLVSTRGRAVPLPASEIEALRQGLKAGGRAEPHPFLKVGRRIRVVSGPFTGISGVLMRKKDSLRVVVSLEIIMRSVAVEVDACDIEPAPEN